MVVSEIHLGITRNCTLYCEHCLRGEKECVNMSLETLDNIFKDITKVDLILLTGGEPLIAVQQLEHLASIIRNRRIQVGEIRLITNGTIYSPRILRVLKEFQELVFLRMLMSDDIFHLLELDRLGLLERRNLNYNIYKEVLGLKMYGTEEEVMYTQLLEFKGRTKTLTLERLAEINKMIKCAYTTTEAIGIPLRTGERLFFLDDYLFGQLTIDVHGNIVGYGLEYVEEDQEEMETGLNVNQLGLREATEKYIEIQDRKREAAEAKLLQKTK